MGFGSYDESEQQHQQTDDEDVDAVNVHKNDHDGQLSFESDVSTDQLITQLGAMKDDGGDDD